MEHDLIEAAKQGDVNVLYAAISSDPSVLDKLDSDPFSDTPFHLAASGGQTHFALEIMMLKPSLARKLNQNGSSPMHLATMHKHEDVVRGLLAKDKDLVRVDGKGGKTPLHCLAASGANPSLLQEMLFACPDSIKDLTIRRETALHLSVKNGQLDTFEVLVQAIQKFRKEEIYSWKDEEGYTALHHATIGGQSKMIEFLFQKYRLKEWNLKVEVQDDNNRTALDMVNSLPETNEDRDKIRDILLLGTREGMRIGRYFRYINHQLSVAVQEVPPESQEALLVVLALVVTTSFQVGVNPPGGFWQDDSVNNRDDRDNHHAGTPILAKTNPILYFLISFFTMAGFASSLNLIVVLTMGMPLKNLLILATAFMSSSYFIAFIAITRKLIWIIIASYGSVTLLLGIIFFFYAWKFIKHKLSPKLAELSHVKTM